MATRWISARQLADLLDSRPLRRPAYQDLSHRLRLLAVDGRLVDGVRLPSERELAAQLKLSRSTVAAAYAVLRDQGCLRTRQGSGNYLELAPTSQGPGLGGPARGRRGDHDDVQRGSRRPGGGRRVRPSRRAAAQPAGRTRVPAGGASRAPGAARRLVRRARPGHRSDAGDHHRRRARCTQSGHRDAARAGRPGAGRIAELSQRPGGAPATRSPAGRCADGGAGLGLRHAQGRDSAVRTPAGLPHPRLPQPDRPVDERRGPGATGPDAPPRALSTGHRRNAGRAQPRRRRHAAAVRRRPGGRDHHRLGQQDVLGRLADRLDPGPAHPGPTAGRGPGHGRPGRRGDRAAGARRAADRAREDRGRAAEPDAVRARPPRTAAVGCPTRVAGVDARRRSNPLGRARPTGVQ